MNRVEQELARSLRSEEKKAGAPVFQRQQRASAKREEDDDDSTLPFKDAVEKFAELNGIEFLPNTKRGLKDGKQIYHFGKCSVYLDKGCVYVWEKAKLNEDDMDDDMDGSSKNKPKYSGDLSSVRTSVCAQDPTLLAFVSFLRTSLETNISASAANACDSKSGASPY